ncbi:MULTISPECIES: sugar transferase [Acinetobacter]|jgi:lipopolysaccharide/colanic/teichoic acid biosynthesis glycosyltransferase|uniref:sugar transferase n=1 Tax=Acinetobacter TaxID=469 RepID=UPI0015B3D15E|nr:MULTISPECIES: sugar transferase [Acinetobacter]MBT0887319.1 sugar transferase [Acinetobacter towneri]MDV2455240.1 sugar transferase [Acinetobacter towneri]MDV2485148.1 sugar transferase [Acinetobacter towneri]NWJ92726.1 sugar transferase [Acinetobacter sp. Swhac1]UIZ57655.1 sugar transferase [Acinetobacter sp. SCLZS86]
MKFTVALKRLTDLIISLFLLILLSPILILCTLFIKLGDKGPIFYKQQRVGLNGCFFEILKFRSMSVNENREISQTFNTDPEVTWIGRVMRRTKIDELPQLINVVKGDMGLVGPRPCLTITYKEMPEWAKERFKVRPGMTGLAQINGNIFLSWEERWKYDIQYVKTLSILNDIKIVFKTILVVIFGEDKFKKDVK